MSDEKPTPKEPQKCTMPLSSPDKKNNMDGSISAGEKEPLYYWQLYL